MPNIKDRLNEHAHRVADEVVSQRIDWLKGPRKRAIDWLERPSNPVVEEGVKPFVAAGAGLISGAYLAANLLNEGIARLVVVATGGKKPQSHS